MAAITSAIIAAGGSAYSIIQGAKAKNEANQAASSAAQSIAQMQEADKFKNLQVPTLGLEMAQQNVQARQAQQLQGLQDVGAAGVLGGLTALNQQGQAEDLALSAQAQNAQYERDLYQAQNAQGVEQRNLARQAGLETARLEGAQSAAAYGQSQINSGIQGLAETAGNVLVQSIKNKPLYEDKTKDLITPELSAKTKDLNTSQQVSQNMYNRGQNVLTTPIQTGLQSLPAIPNINVLSPQQMQRGAQGQYENFLKNNSSTPASTNTNIPQDQLDLFKNRTKEQWAKWRRENLVKDNQIFNNVSDMYKAGYIWNPQTKDWEW